METPPKSKIKCFNLCGKLIAQSDQGDMVDLAGQLGLNNCSLPEIVILSAKTSDKTWGFWDEKNVGKIEQYIKDDLIEDGFVVNIKRLSKVSLIPCAIEFFWKLEISEETYIEEKTEKDKPTKRFNMASTKELLCNQENLKAAYSQNQVLRAICDHMAARNRNQKETNIDRIICNLKKDGATFKRSEVIAAFRELKEAGCGEYVKGRYSRPSRFVWKVKSLNVSGSAKDKIENYEKNEEDDDLEKKKQPVWRKLNNVTVEDYEEWLMNLNYEPYIYDPLLQSIDWINTLTKAIKKIKPLVGKADYAVEFYWQELSRWEFILNSISIARAIDFNLNPPYKWRGIIQTFKFWVDNLRSHNNTRALYDSGTDFFYDMVVFFVSRNQLSDPMQLSKQVLEYKCKDK